MPRDETPTRVGAVPRKRQEHPGQARRVSYNHPPHHCTVETQNHTICIVKKIEKKRKKKIEKRKNSEAPPPPSLSLSPK
jgi:hypothetical protein